jgi:hypothetical protein
MNSSLWNSRGTARVVSLCIVSAALTVTLPSRFHAEARPAPAKVSDLAQQIVGTWVYVGAPGAVVEPPATGARFKTIQHGLYKVAQKDAEGTVIYHHGGTYTLTGDQYAETCEYSSKVDSELVKQTYRFAIKIEGDKLIQTGVGNPYTEVWKRVQERVRGSASAQEQ